MISKIRVTILFFCFLFSCKDNNAGPLLNGIDVFFNQNLDEYSGEKVALVLNHTSVNRNGRSLLDLSQEKLNVVAIFTPEHGLFGTAEAGKKIDDNTYQGISVFSLYGKNKAPTSKQLQGIDLILFDMQDIGSRYYTYISTLSHVMKSASDNDIKVVILDRVNPIGRKIEGPTLKYEHSSFVGMHPVPIRHGLTIGEFSNMIAELNWMEFSYRPRLEIIPVSGWNGGYSDITTKPSPNIEDLEAALIYTGMCLLEGTNLSEGRGTNTPFKLFGAPWMNSDEVINKVGNLNGVELSSGAIRNHIPELMYKLFDIAGYSKKDVDEKFSGMINALSYGAPPHGGIAPGIDRIIMLLADEKNIREITMFPMNQNAQDLMMNAPSNIDEDQLKELNLSIKKKD